MTDKDFDILLKEVLSSDDVPASLNESLVNLACKRENKKAKILKFVKSAASCAAIFVCAVAVLSHFNSDLFLRKNTSPIKGTNTHSQKENSLVSRENDPATIQDGASDVSVASVTEDAAYNLAETENSNMNTFSMRRGLVPQSLEMLFNEDYDYKTIISERISAQIALMDFPEKINFSKISGNESFSLNENNELTIQFAAGTIASEKHGDLFFTVGTVQNGVLE